MYFYSKQNSFKRVFFSIALFGTSVAFGSQPMRQGAAPKAPRQSEADISRVTGEDMGQGLLGGIAGFFAGIGVRNFFAPKGVGPNLSRLRSGQYCEQDNDAGPSIIGIMGAAFGGFSLGYLSYSHRQRMFALKREHREEMRKKDQEETEFSRNVRCYFRRKNYFFGEFRGEGGAKEYNKNIFKEVLPGHVLDKVCDPQYLARDDARNAECDAVEAYIFHTFGIPIATRGGDPLVRTPETLAALRRRASPIVTAHEESERGYKAD
jgi:hypothetical protein